MKRIITIVLSVTLAMSVVKPVQATLWNFSYSATSVTFGNGALDSYSGVLNVDATNRIVGITGTSNLFGSITGLLAPHTFFNNDNVFTGVSPFLDVFGVGFSTSGGKWINLFNNGGAINAINCPALSGECSPPAGYFTSGNFVSTASVPEPGTLSLLGLALTGLLLARRRIAG